MNIILYNSNIIIIVAVSFFLFPNCMAFSQRFIFDAISSILLAPPTVSPKWSFPHGVDDSKSLGVL